MPTDRFVQNPTLETLPVAGWRGNPLDARGRFVNPDHPFVPAMLDHLKWSLEPNRKRAEKRADRWRVEAVRDDRFLKSRAGEDVLIWLGHASFFVRLAGVSMLIDPIFGGFPGIPRRSEPPFLPEDFDEIDLVLVSHDHRDHCDKRSIQKITKAFPRAQILTGLGTGDLLQKWAPKSAVQAAGWYQKFETERPEIELFYLPARHWARRWAFDTNRNLWGAFVLRGAGRTIYFSGDTGYGVHFRQTARLFPQIDEAIIGVGTYQPAFASPMHIDPENAVRAFSDLGAATLVPMHFGTFDLSDEPFGEPLRRMKNALSRSDGLRVLAVGENHFFAPKAVADASFLDKTGAAMPPFSFPIF